MKKKIAVAAMTVTIILQLCVPCYAIYKKYDVINTGSICNFRVAWFTAYETDDYCELSFSTDSFGYKGFYDDIYAGRYAVIEQGADGFSYVSSITNIKPSGSSYFTAPNGRTYFEFPFCLYRTDKELYEKILAFSDLYLQDGQPAVTVCTAVKDGRAFMLGFNVNGVPIEEYIAGLD